MKRNSARCHVHFTLLRAFFYNFPWMDKNPLLKICCHWRIFSLSIILPFSFFHIFFNFLNILRLRCEITIILATLTNTANIVVVILRQHGQNQLQLKRRTSFRHVKLERYLSFSFISQLIAIPKNDFPEFQRKLCCQCLGVVLATWRTTFGEKWRRFNFGYQFFGKFEKFSASVGRRDALVPN